MKRRVVSGLAVLSFALLAMSGCAGVGKGTPAQPAKAEKTTAVVTLSTDGTLPPGNSIGGIDVTLNLPPGVTAKADKTTATLPGVVAASGGAQGAPSVAKFTPAAGNAPGQVRMVLVKPAGFGTGEFATVVLDIGGAPPLATDFSTAGFKVTNTEGVPLNGLSAVLSLQLR